MKALTRTITLVVALATSSASLANESLYPPWDGWDSWRESTIQVGWDYGYETGTLNDASVTVDLVSVAGASTTNQRCWNYQTWTAPADDYYRFTFNYNASGWASLSGASVFGDASWIAMRVVLRILPSWATWEEGPYRYNYWRCVAATSGIPYIPTPAYEYDEDVQVTTGPIWFQEGETVSIAGGIQILPTCVSLIGFVSILSENTGQLNSVQIVRENPPTPILAVDPDPPSHDYGPQFRLEDPEWTFNIWNGGIWTLQWTVTDDRSWLQVSPAEGSSTGDYVPTTVTVDADSLSPGHHVGHITVHAYYTVPPGFTIDVGTRQGLIEVDIINIPPVADANGPYYAGAGENITFDASESIDIDGTIAGFRWDWDNDGTWDTAWLGTPTADHSFSPNGLYRSRLQVKDNDGETSTDVCATHVGYAWEKDVVDFEGDTGWECAIALDSDGRPHVSYMDFEDGNRLKYARWTGTEWLREDVAPSYYGWRATSIALDSNDNPHIAYRGVHGDAHPHLCYASKTGSTWTIQTVDAEHFCAYSCDLAIDESNAPHIVYTGHLGVENSYLKYAHWNGSQWALESVGTTTGRTGTFAAVALDWQGRPHACCYDEGNVRLMYARRIGGSWDVHNDLDSDGGFAADIAVDGNGNPHVCYVIGRDSPETGELRWIHSPNGGASWNAPERVDGVPGEYDAVGSCAIAVGANDEVHISYGFQIFSPAFRCLKYATKLGTQWTDEIVDIRENMDTSLALDAAGLPHIAYFAFDWRALHYATLAGPTNSPPVADANGPYSGDIGETIVFNASGSYDFDGTIVGYRWDWNNDGAWDTEWDPWPQASYVFGEGGTHTVVLEVEDDGGSRDTDTTTVDVPNDTQPPQIVDDSDGDAFVGETFVFRATVTDDLGVAEVWVEYWYDEGDHWSHSMGQVDVDAWERSTTILDGFTTLHYIIFAEDVAGNPADTGTQDVAITDAGPDCNNNGIPDDEDIASGFSEDCQPNGIPDECDVDPNDPDGNGQVSPDNNGNGIPDDCEPAICLDPPDLTNACAHGEDAPDQAFEVWNCGLPGTTLSYTIMDDAAWLECDPNYGTSDGEHDTITVYYDTATLALGEYMATITISDPAASNDPQTIAVTLTVTGEPTICFDPPELTLTCVYGEDAPDQSFEVWNCGLPGTTLSYTITDDANDPDWLWCDAGGTSTGEHDTITVYYDTAALALGEYTAMITISDPAASNDPQTVDVTLTVTCQATICLDPTELTPTCVYGEDAVEQTFEVWNCGPPGTTLPYTITDDTDWLECDPNNGTSDGEHDTITVQYTTAALDCGQHTATITISDPAASNDPQTIAVSLTVTEEDVDPIAHWPLDEGSGSFAEDIVGSHDGTIYGDPPWVEGVSGYALDFDGSNDYVNVGRFAQFGGTQPFSLCAWINRTTTSGSEPYILNNMYSSSRGIGIFSHGDYSAVTVGGADGGAGQATVWDYENIADGGWHLIVGTYNGSALELYIDGEWRDSNSSFSYYTASTQNMNIGRMEHQARLYFQGAIDDVRIYDRALSEPEVLALYEEHHPGEPPCPGDLDGDNDVDIADLAQLLANYGITSGATPEQGDIDGDGDVDLSDLAALVAVYGMTCE